MSKPVLTLEERGGPAFPLEVKNDDGTYFAIETGMSLRDWFAGQALIALLSQRSTLIDNLGHVFPSEKEPVCRAAFAFADAMLASRLRAVSQP